MSKDYFKKFRKAIRKSESQAEVQPSKNEVTENLILQGYVPRNQQASKSLARVKGRAT